MELKKNVFSFNTVYNNLIKIDFNHVSFIVLYIDIYNVLKILLIESYWMSSSLCFRIHVKIDSNYVVKYSPIGISTGLCSLVV